MRGANDFVDGTGHLALGNFKHLSVFDLNESQLAALLSSDDIEGVHCAYGLGLLRKADGAQDDEVVL